MGRLFPFTKYIMKKSKKIAIYQHLTKPLQSLNILYISLIISDPFLTIPKVENLGLFKCAQNTIKIRKMQKATEKSLKWSRSPGGLLHFKLL
jgi:hypothetical protein